MQLSRRALLCGGPPTLVPVKILGFESSCDETGVALVEAAALGAPRLLGEALYSQVDMHAAYGGVVPELASRDHIRRVLPLTREVLAQAGCTLADVDLIAYTRGPGLAGALLVGAGVAVALAAALGKPALGIHHLEGHLLSPFLGEEAPQFPFVALLVSGGHTQLMQVDGVGRYALLGETIDDAAGEAFDKSAKLLGLPYPGGPELARIAAGGEPGQFKFPRPMLDRAGLEFSFSGLKTAVSLAVRGRELSDQLRADVAREVQQAIVDVLVEKSLRALRHSGHASLVVAGGVGANKHLRQSLTAAAARVGARVYYPRHEFCTDNAAMIAVAGLARLRAGQHDGLAIAARAQWPLASLTKV